MLGHHRFFVAIDLPKAVGWELARLVADTPRGVRPVRPAQLHLTLHFLGDVDDWGQTALRASLAQVRHEPFTIAILGTGVFPPRGRPSVLWAGVTDAASLASLQAAIGAAIEAVGFDVERRPYVPHITLARLSPAVPRAWVARFLSDTAGMEAGKLPVDQFYLYESRKLDGATEHSVVAEYPLHGAD